MKNNFLPWSSVTREERYFCSHLYHSILGREKDFVNWLNDNLKPNGKIKLNHISSWEIGFEVCFYRDFLKASGQTIKDYNTKNGTKYSPKRTFDLCLFSEDEFIIIEAKVQQGFSLKQLDEIIKDEELVSQLLTTFKYPNKKIKTIFIYSSKYSPKEKSIIDFPCIAWKDLNNSPFKDGILFNLADEKYGN